MAGNIRWRKGDFGRYRFEDKHKPTFEFHGKDKDGMIHLWHSGEDHIRLIPIRTFQKDCERGWILKKLQPLKPEWLVDGARLKWGGAQVIVRSVQFDYFSILDDEVLRFFKTGDAEKYFTPDVTSWDLLDTDFLSEG